MRFEQQPRSNENGGCFGSTGVIVKRYRPGSVIEVGVELTANHQGFFEFRLCPLNNQTTPETDECFDQNLLELAETNGTK